MKGTQRIYALVLISCLFVYSAVLHGDTFRPELILQTGHSRPVDSGAISPDNRWLASGSQGSTVKIWEIQKYSPHVQSLPED